MPKPRRAVRESSDRGSLYTERSLGLMSTNAKNRHANGRHRGDRRSRFFLLHRLHLETLEERTLLSTVTPGPEFQVYTKI